MAKQKVAPLKIQTIPRLELEAEKIGVKLVDYIMESLGYAVQVENYYW